MGINKILNKHTALTSFKLIIKVLTSAPSSNSFRNVVSCPPAAAAWRGVYCYK